MIFEIMPTNLVSKILDRLQSGECVADHEFNRIYPKKIRKLAPTHWTPVNIAKRAAELLISKPGTRILDVGSGAGKFCLVGAAVTQGIFTGVEQRKYLVESSRNIALQFKWPRVNFITADAGSINWNDFDGIYFFNPFAENIYKSIRMDEELDFGGALYSSSISMTQMKLMKLRTGVKVALLQGFGGLMPPQFQLIHEEACGNGRLQLWDKI